jgi:threonine dehydrogenase-like Zn-dependent dehydrogenase
LSLDPSVEDSQRFVVIGDTTSAQRVCASLQARGHTVDHMVAPDDARLHEAMRPAPAGVAVLSHSDDTSLRYALAVSHLNPDVAIVAAIFDATMSEQIGALLPNCVVTSPGVLASPALAAACLTAGSAAIVTDGSTGTRELLVDGGRVTAVAWPHHLGFAQRTWRAITGGQRRPPDAGAWITLVGLLGIFALLAIDAVWLMALGVSPLDAFQEAASVVATVGPVAHHGGAYSVFSGVAMLLTIGFVAAFTAGLIEQLLGPRLVGLFGSRAIPRSGHVVVIGLGQVGMRLCRYLRALNVPVVAVERDPDSRYVAMARNFGIPVLLGHGNDRFILQKLHLKRAIALAAVGSADLDNVTVAVNTRVVAPGTRVVMRAGEHEAIAETASLVPLGVSVDVTCLSSAFVAARVLGHEAVRAIPNGSDALVELTDGSFVPWSAAHHGDCPHC